jgi:hypothetical protein
MHPPKEAQKKQKLDEQTKEAADECFGYFCSPGWAY